MKLRKLKLDDAPLMLEWMHDENVIKYLNQGFVNKNYEDCVCFIAGSQSDRNNMHLAIADENDMYMGTVSLKNISKEINAAEFAITIRSCAMGKGFADFAMKEMLKNGFETLKLSNIYWCVAVENKRALKFYNKHCGIKIETINVPQYLLNNYSEQQTLSLMWYVVDKRMNYKE